jgi:O-antigen ligase
MTRKALLGMGVALLVTFTLFGPGLAHRLGQFGDESGTHTARWEWWMRALREWTWSPFVGEGLGRYNDADRRWSGVKHVVYVVTKATVVNNAFHAHNSYVHFLAEGGIIGFGMTVGFWGWIAWRLRRSREPIRIAALLGILYLLAISMTEHYMGGGILLLVLSSIVGAAWSLPEAPLAAVPPLTSAGESSPANASPAPSPSPH